MKETVETMKEKAVDAAQTAARAAKRRRRGTS